LIEQRKWIAVELANQSDSELISMFLDGQAAAFDTLVRRYERQVFGFIFGMVQNEALANDLFQETFIRIINALPDYRERGKFASWLLGIARNLALDALRKRRVEGRIFRLENRTTDSGNAESTYPEIPDDIESQADMVEREEWLVRMREALAELPVEQREVVYLRYEADLTFQQIADLTGVSINTALGRMRYALNSLRKRMNVATEPSTNE
jgi:RNA polymerase sigma-70 factor (ECF subfamily)